MSKNKNEGRGKGAIKHVALVFLGTFFLAVVISTITNATVENVKYIALAFLVLIVIGVIFDGIGVAVAVADMAPFNARAARKAPGAKKTLSLLKKADVVANICCDVVGDICGIVSGAIGSTIALLILAKGDFNTIVISAIMAGMVSGLTVGGKAIMKSLAIREANKIMELVGIVLDYKNWSRLLSKNKKEKAES
ncbi:MAG: hypothetical protein Q4C00_00520 [Bacillota bacterium]|nr:hypothetical protein [Bacillota bacterium]